MNGTCEWMGKTDKLGLCGINRVWKVPITALRFGSVTMAMFISLLVYPYFFTGVFHLFPFIPKPKPRKLGPCSDWLSCGWLQKVLGWGCRLYRWYSTHGSTLHDIPVGNGSQKNAKCSHTHHTATSSSSFEMIPDLHFVISEMKRLTLRFLGD